MADQIFMNEVSDPNLQIQILEEMCAKLSKVEFAVGEQKFFSSLEGNIWKTEKEIYVKLNPESEVQLKSGETYKATILGSGQVLGLIVSVKEINEKVIKLDFPKKVFKINRREAFRFNIPTAYDIPVSVVVGTKKITARLHDISLDGIGVWLDLEQLKVGEKIQQVYFKLENKEVYASGEVKVCFPFEYCKKKGFKVGIKLEKIASGGQTFIINYMNRHLSQYAKKIA